MRLLGVLGLVLVHARAAGHVFCAVAVLDRVAGGVHGLGRHVDAICSHVCNQARFIQALSRGHRLPCAKAELAAGFLLQGRCHKGRAGVTCAGLGLDTQDAQIARGDGLHGHFRIGAVAKAELIQLFTGKRREARLKRLTARCFEHGFYGPVFLRLKDLNLHLALNDNAQTNRLHTSGGSGPWQFAPQNGR